MRYQKRTVIVREPAAAKNSRTKAKDPGKYVIKVSSAAKQRPVLSIYFCFVLFLFFQGFRRSVYVSDLLFLFSQKPKH